MNFKNLRPLFAPDNETGAAAPSASPASGGGSAPASSPSSPPPGTPATPATPSPSPAPSSAPAASIEEPRTFEGLGGFDDDVVEMPDDEALGAASPAPTPQEPPVVAAPPPVTPPAPTPTEATPPTPQGTAPQAPAPSAPEGPVNLAQQLDAHRNEVIQHLAATEFALSPEEAEQMNAIDPALAKLVPGAMARVYHKAIQSSLLHMQQFAPLIAANVVAAMQQSTEAERAFYDKFKYLDKSKHGADVQNFLNVFRQQQPGLKQEELWAKAAAAVSVLHGLSPIASPPQQPQIPQAPSFIPATPGGGVRVQQLPDEWGGMGANFDD